MWRCYSRSRKGGNYLNLITTITCWLVSCFKPVQINSNLVLSDHKIVFARPVFWARIFLEIFSYKFLSFSVSSARFLTYGIHISPFTPKHQYAHSLHCSLYTLTSVCTFSLLFSIHFQMCWQREFVQQSRGSLVDYHFLYSHDLNVWFMGDIERRN